jgi:hypothetical protein
MPFYSKLLPLPMNEFIYAPVDLITSVATSDIDCNSSGTVTFSTDTFGPLFPKTIIVSGIHLTLGLDLHNDVGRYRCQLVKMDPCTPLHRLPQWKSHIQYTYILSINTMSIHTVDNVCLVIS